MAVFLERVVQERHAVDAESFGRHCAHLHGLLGDVRRRRVGPRLAHAAPDGVGDAVGIGHHAGESDGAPLAVGVADEVAQVRLPGECCVYGNSESARLIFGQQRIKLLVQFGANSRAFCGFRFLRERLAGCFCLGAQAVAYFGGWFALRRCGMCISAVHGEYCTPRIFVGKASERGRFQRVFGARFSRKHGKHARH